MKTIIGIITSGKEIYEPEGFTILAGTQIWYGEESHKHELKNFKFHDHYDAILLLEKRIKKIEMLIPVGCGYANPGEKELLIKWHKLMDAKICHKRLAGLI